MKNLLDVLSACFDRFDRPALAEWTDRASTNVLALIGAFHVAFLTSLIAAIFVASATMANASADNSCQGENLLEKLADENPERYAAVLKSAAATAYGDSILFEISKLGVAPSYLFGTMHLTDPRVTDLPPKAAEALNGAQTVAIEATGILDETAMQAQLLARPEMTMFVGDDRLTDFMDDEQRAIVEEGLAEKGMRLALVDRMKPWILSGMLALPACEMDRKTAGAAILDVAIAKVAQDNGKELVGLETIMEQLEAMASLPMQAHVEGLVDTLRMGAMVEDAIETMIVLYEDGQTGKIWPLLRALAAELSDERENADPTLSEEAFEEIMVHARNKTMFERSLPLLEAGNAFIAVGALHLPGDEGLAQMFADAGYTVTALR